MAISKLTFLSPKAGASDVDAFGGAGSRRANKSPGDEDATPSFDETLEESRSQYAQARSPTRDSKSPGPAKPAKPSNADDQTDGSDGAQSAKANPPGPTDGKAEKSDDDDDSKAAATDTDTKKDKTSKNADPSTVVVVQPTTAALTQATLTSLTPAVATQPSAGKAALDANDTLAATPQAGPPPDETKGKSKSEQAASVKGEAQPDPGADATDSGNTANTGDTSNTSNTGSLPPDNHLSADARKEQRAAQAADASPPDADANKDPVPAAATVTAVATVLEAAASSAVSGAQAAGSAPAKTEASNDPQGVPSMVALTGPVAHAVSAKAAPAAQVSHAASPDDPMDQIVLGLKSKMDPRTGKAEIRLDPPNLGAVKVSLSLQSGSLTAQFESSSAVVRDLLKSHLDRLKTVLESQGVAVDRLAVEAPADTSSQGQSSSFGSASHDGRSAGQYQQDPRQQRGAPDAETFAGLFSQAQEAPLDLVA